MRGARQATRRAGVGGGGGGVAHLARGGVRRARHRPARGAVVTPELAPRELGKIKAWEYLVRFAFGGAVTVLTGVVAYAWGPWVGGLFLAFPAILPASLTLVKRHDGRAQTIDDARGARLATLALWTFAAVVLCLAERAAPAVVLAVATLGWLATAVGLWWI